MFELVGVACRGTCAVGKPDIYFQDIFPLLNLRHPPDYNSNQLHPEYCKHAKKHDECRTLPPLSSDEKDKATRDTLSSFRRKAALTANSALSPMSSGSTARTRFPQFFAAFLSVVAALRTQKNKTNEMPKTPRWGEIGSRSSSARRVGTVVDASKVYPDTNT